ncbi:MAG: hypothetical protein JW936_07400 [Sedimentisphaerales bacterium]|nr:hypothetical protein [Sedimentisphaerales bacterium]
MLLTGEYDLTLDEKNRLSIPVRLRQQIFPRDDFDNVLYLMTGFNQILCLYPESEYRRIALAVAPGKVAPDELLVYERVGFALASRVELDRQGRVLISDKAIRRAGLKEQIALIGARDHLELWNQDEWETYLVEHMAEHEQMVLQARQETYRKQREEAGW